MASGPWGFRPKIHPSYKKVRMRSIRGRWPSPRQEPAGRRARVQEAPLPRSARRSPRQSPNTRRGDAGGAARNMRGHRGVIQRH
ncbi:MAG: hypothetical protein HY554_14945 [Elusimicrobia bacterium]|nr:hypothetical protein [Elusimicrobiota bacterium]